MDTRHVGFVVIGRNESERLSACLASLASFNHVVYVDSASTDNSVEIAKGVGVDVVQLDAGDGLTAAKGRNAGIERLSQKIEDGEIEFVQFIDGDCTLHEKWIVFALDWFKAHPDYAAVAGRRYEEFPEKSVYNALCDMEWNTPIGDALAIGGDGLYRSKALGAVGGFNPALICGEEPELCYRLRSAGWKIARLDHPMTYHDARIFKAAQWLKRTKRAGWAAMEGSVRYGSLKEQGNPRSVARAFVWGLVLPMCFTVALIFSITLSGAAQGIAMSGLFVCTAIFFIMITKIAFNRQSQFGDNHRASFLYGFFTMTGKPAEFSGAISYIWKRLRGVRSSLIEYK